MGGVISGWNPGRKVSITKAKINENYTAEYSASHGKNFCQLYCEI